MFTALLQESSSILLREKKKETVALSQNCKCQLAAVPKKASCSLYSKNSTCPKNFWLRVHKALKTK